MATSESIFNSTPLTDHCGGQRSMKAPAFLTFFCCLCGSRLANMTSLPVHSIAVPKFPSTRERVTAAVYFKVSSLSSSISSERGLLGLSWRWSATLKNRAKGRLRECVRACVRERKMCFVTGLPRGSRRASFQEKICEWVCLCV